MQEKVQEYVLYCDANRELGFMSMSMFCIGSGVCFVL